MKPSLFIGSSTESLPVAYALQENLEHVAEVTVWDQGIFQLSKSSIESLIYTLDRAHFGAFVFAPNDISVIRGETKNTVRDNVIFELGLFIGRLSQDRNFLIVPRGDENSLHLPTDLLGLTPALYDASRQDGNLCAALGPASSKIKKAMSTLSLRSVASKPAHEESQSSDAEYSEEDIKAILKSWMGNRSWSENTLVIYFAEIDKQLHLPPGATKRYLKEVAQRLAYIVEHEGGQTILFKKEPSPRYKPLPGSWKAW